MAKLYVKTHNILWTLQSIKKTVVTIPFTIVLQTPNLEIEKYCLQNWPNLLSMHAFSYDELVAWQKMKAYIKSKFNQHTILIHQYFYDNKWFENLAISDGITGCEITEWNARMWDQKEPMLELKGLLSFDIAKILELYFKKNYIIVNQKTNKFIKEIINIYFEKSLPSILFYKTSSDIRNILLKEITDRFNKKTTWSDKVDKLIKIKDTHNLKKEIRWGSSNNQLEIIISDWQELLKHKAKKYAVPIGIGYFAYQLLKKRK